MRPPLTRAAIVAAARELLVSDGLDAVSLRRIASHVGVTAPALYAYVTDKFDLLRAIATIEIEALAGRLDAAPGNHPVDRLRGLADVYAGYAQENPAIFRAMFLTRPELTTRPANGQPALVTLVLDRVRRAVEATAAAGGISTEDVELTALTYWTALHGAVVTLVAGPRLPAEEAAALVGSVADAVLAGLGVGDGAERRVAAARS